MTMQWGRGGAGLLTMFLAACAAAQPAALTSKLAPADAYTCVVRAATARGYSVANGDRASGFVTLEKASGGLAGRFWTEIRATVLPEGDGSRLQLTPQRSVEENGRRRTAGIVTVGKDAEDMAAIQAACGG